MVRVACSVALDVFSITNRHQLFFPRPHPLPAWTAHGPCAHSSWLFVYHHCGRSVAGVLGWECMFGAAFLTRGVFFRGCLFFCPLLPCSLGGGVLPAPCPNGPWHCPLTHCRCPTPFLVHFFASLRVGTGRAGCLLPGLDLVGFALCAGSMIVFLATK
jgi:hypothetical protein